MKKLGYLLSIVGIVLIIVSVSLSGGSNNNSKKADIPVGNTKKMTKSITLKHRNRYKPGIITFNFSTELSCKSENEYEFNCDFYGTGKDKLNSDIRGSVFFNNTTTLKELIDVFKKQYTFNDIKVSDINICKGDMICARKDETVYYEGGKFSNYRTQVSMYISNGDGYYTNVLMYLLDYNEDKNHDTRINNYINEFVKSIKIDEYVEEEKKYKDDKLAITLYTPRFNESSKITMYIDKNKYHYPDSLFEYTNNKAYIYHNDSKLTNGVFMTYLVDITYLYDEIDVGNKDASTLQRFTDYKSSVNIVSEIAESIKINGKELYHNKNSKNEYIYIINDNYALHIKSTIDIEEDLLKDIINFEYVK